MCEVKVSVITKNAFIYEAIIHILKKNSNSAHSIHNQKNDDYLLDKDIVFYETVPGELFLSNTKFMKCKPAWILFILHYYKSKIRCPLPNQVIIRSFGKVLL